MEKNKEKIINSMATAQISYNTKGDLCKTWKEGKYRDFFLTLNCEIDDDKDKSKIELLKKLNRVMKYLTSLKYSYIISSLELNKKNFYHIHIFIQFNTPHKLSTSKTEGAHINIINKTINQVINYVKKDGVILKEIGTPRYITGNPSIKDIALSRFTDINENGNAKYYRIYKEIKKDNQGLFNTPKKIYIRHQLERNDKFKDFNFLDINEKGKIKYWPTKMIIKNKQLNQTNIDLLLNEYNEPIQHKFFPADIEEILFIIPQNIKYNSIADLIRYHTTSKPDLFTLDNIDDNGEIDTEEFTNSLYPDS